MANSPPIRSDADPPKFSPSEEPVESKTTKLAEVSPQPVELDISDKPSGAEAMSESKPVEETKVETEAPPDPVKKKSPIK